MTGVVLFGMTGVVVVRMTGVVLLGMTGVTVSSMQSGARLARKRGTMGVLRMTNTVVVLGSARLTASGQPGELMRWVAA